MSEPGLYSLLMRNVSEEERTGASSLNFLAVFAVQAIAALTAGPAIARFGYTPTLFVASAVALFAAACFTLLLGPFTKR